MGKLFSKKTGSFYIPNGIASLFKLVEVPHNIGGVSMGNSKNDGVVDTFGRVYGYNNFMVLDGSILPKSLGPKPSLSVLAFSERGAEEGIKQMMNDNKISAVKMNTQQKPKTIIMNDFTKSVIVGIIGTIAMSLFMMVIAMLGMPKMSAPNTMAEGLGASIIVGWIIHLMIGIAFALIYTYIVSNWLRKISSLFLRELFLVLSLLLWHRFLWD